MECLIPRFTWPLSGSCQPVWHTYFKCDFFGLSLFSCCHVFDFLRFCPHSLISIFIWLWSPVKHSTQALQVSGRFVWVYYMLSPKFIEDLLLCIFKLYKFILKLVCVIFLIKMHPNLNTMSNTLQNQCRKCCIQIILIFLKIYI